MSDLPLSKFRVVEIGTGDTLGYCGKLFSDFGADVIKIEPPGAIPHGASHRWSTRATGNAKASPLRG